GNAIIIKGMLGGTRCRLWAEDKYGTRIGGDGAGDYESCDGVYGGRQKNINTGSTEPYAIVVRVQGTLRAEKWRGLYSGNITCRLT
ncbi:1205_t:CDS:1, partial [Dentiscutata heterogama]